MLTYNTYKVLHFAAIFLFLGSVALSLFGSNKQKGAKILTGISTLLIFVAGMGLMAKTGIPHPGPWPLWIKIKAGLWLLLAISAPILVKRLSVLKATFYFSLIVFPCILAAYVVVYKITSLKFALG